MSSNNSPLISVVVPCHNCQSTITRLVNSLKGQKRRAGWDVVFVDDHSTDHTMELLYKTFTPTPVSPFDPRFNIAVNPSIGAGSARNFGMEKTTGKFLWFMDSDDFLARPDAFSIVMDAVGSNQDVDLFHVNCGAVDGVGRGVSDNFTNLRVPSELCDKVLTSSDFGEKFTSLYPVIGFSPWNKIVRRKFLDDHGIRFQNTLFCNDQYFSVRVMVESEKMYMLSAPPVYCWTTAGRFHLTNSGLRQTHPEQYKIVLEGIEKDCMWPNDEIREKVMDDRRTMLEKSSGRSLSLE